MTDVHRMPFNWLSCCETGLNLVNWSNGKGEGHCSISSHLEASGDVRAHFLGFLFPTFFTLLIFQKERIFFEGGLDSTNLQLQSKLFCPRLSTRPER